MQAGAFETLARYVVIVQAQLGNINVRKGHLLM